MTSLRFPFGLLALASRLAVPPIERVGHSIARRDMRVSASRLRFLFGPPAEMSDVREASLAGVRVRRFVPPGPAAGAVVYFHGGGWVVGDLDTHDTVCRALASASSREVISVDYRLAPEHRFPAAIDDALAVTRALARERRVVVAGDSAGGHLAAVVARRCAASGDALAGQLLTYPVTDCASESGSYARYATGHLLTRETMRYFKDAFIPDVSLRSEPDASPLRAPALRTAPAYVLLAGCDVLHDEGAAYAEKLRGESTDVTVDDVPGVLHGFVSMQGIRVSRDALGRAATWVRRTLS